MFSGTPHPAASAHSHGEHPRLRPTRQRRQATYRYEEGAPHSCVRARRGNITLSRWCPEFRITVKRRDFIALLGGAATFLPLVGATRQASARIGLLGVPPPSDPIIAPLWAAFIQELQQKGWQDGRNTTFDRRWSEGRPESYPES